LTLNSQYLTAGTRSIAAGASLVGRQQVVKTLTETLRVKAITVMQAHILIGLFKAHTVALNLLASEMLTKAVYFMQHILEIKARLQTQYLKQ
jgi:hypothetical protein